MNIKKPLLIVGAVASIGAAGLTGGALVSAEETQAGPDSLINKIAQKFNLKTEDVKAVFDEERTAKQVERQASIEKELSKLVADGKLTAEQKDKIIAKQKEIQAQRESERDSMKDKTHEERKAAMDAKRAELEQWATDNNIPKEYLRYVVGHGGHRKGHGPNGPVGM
jgi:hypothetical protein